MHIQLLTSVLLMALCAHAIPVTISKGGSSSSSSPSSSSSSSASGIVVESNGTDVVAGNESNTDDPGKTIFVPSNSGAIVVPTQEDPSVLAGSGVTITGGDDGVVILPGGKTGGLTVS